MACIPREIQREILCLSTLKLFMRSLSVYFARKEDYSQSGNALAIQVTQIRLLDFVVLQFTAVLNYLCLNHNPPLELVLLGGPP